MHLQVTSNKDCHINVTVVEESNVKCKYFINVQVVPTVGAIPEQMYIVTFNTAP